MADGTATWLNQVTYDAGELRLADGVGLAPGGTLAGRPGVRPYADPLVAVGGTPEAATVQPHTGICNVANTDGSWRYAVPQVTGVALTARPAAGSSRIDLVVVRVYDADVAALSTTKREVDVEVVVGTAAATPTAPSAPAGSVRLAQLNVPASGNVTVTSAPQRTVAAGGVLPVATLAERDGLPVVYDGMVVYREDSAAVEVRTGGQWQQLQATGGSVTTPYARMETSSQAISSSGSAVQVGFATVKEAAPASFADAGNGQLVVPTDGIYVVASGAAWDSNVSGARALQVRADGNVIMADYEAAVNFGPAQPIMLSAPYRLAAGTTLQAWATQNSGATLNLSGATGGTFLSALWVRP